MSITGRNHGFTLIEVLVASAIVIGSMGILIQLFAQGLEQLNRVSYHSRRLIVEQELVSRLWYVNPADQSTGEGEISGWPYEWNAVPTTENRSLSRHYGDDTGRRTVAVFDISVTVYPENAKPFDLSFTRIGWQDGRR